MVDLGTVITVHRCRGVIQRRQQICLNVVYLRNILVDTIKNVFQMAGIDL